MKKETEKKLLKIVSDNYREIATQFDVTRKKYVWPELERLLTFLKDGDRVLDVGCGNGRLLENVGERKISYLGIDSSEALIKIAKKNYPDNNFEVLDILNLTTLNEKFDLVISVAVLHHLPSKELRLEALKGFKELSASRGKIIFSVWKIWPNKKYWKYLLKNIWDIITFRSDLEFGDLLFPWKDNQGKPLSERYYHAFTKSGLRRLLRQAGFKNFQLYSDKHNYWVSIDTP